MTEIDTIDTQSMLGRARELGHVVLYVRDLNRSLAFYRDILGWAVIGPPGRDPVARFRAGNSHHDLLLVEVGPDAAPLPRGPRVGAYHFGVKVGDSDDHLRALLARIQARPDLGSRYVRPGSLFRVVGAADEGFAHSLYIQDPDGNEVELYVDLPG